MPAPSTGRNADEISRTQDLLRQRKTAGIGTVLGARQESAASMGRQSSVLADWRELRPGDTVVLLPSAGEAVGGIIDDVSSDGSLIWIFQDDCGGRRLFHRADSCKTLLDVGARPREPNA
ncbi:hypothetical protein [Arthrobacter sp. YN]|uniref:hypothetical protein n=1 Tax=Arthrobacter sp. YN TaxID=2020486 RepID=UPI000B6214CA|nr:hypothetical protein [Arthrobacter sp. YN]ASN19990.1 hypothetical protein CGK93_10110 [Arthrobacter sp. YN]